MARNALAVAGLSFPPVVDDVVGRRLVDSLLERSLQLLLTVLLLLLFSISSLYSDSSLRRLSLFRISFSDSEVRKVAAFLILVVVAGGGDEEEVVVTGESRCDVWFDLPGRD